MVNEKVHPLPHYIVGPARNKQFKIGAVLPGQRPHARYGNDSDSRHHAVHDDEFSFALATLVKAVNVNWLVVVRIKINSQAEIVVKFRHTLFASRRLRRELPRGSML